LSDQPVLLLAGGDILARGRIEGVASGAGMELRTVLPNRLADELHALRPAILVLDLDAGRHPLLDQVGAARAEGVLPDRVVGYVSHVDEELASAARSAGVDVYPRGRFWRQLHDLLAPG
jgi:hypothetical protein